MILTCPRCPRQMLNDAPHGASRCPNCGGMFVPRSRFVELLVAGDADLVSGTATASNDAAAQCPADRSIMLRARVEPGAGHEPIHIDRCGSCLGVWFDPGEWTALASAHLLEHLDELWTAEWRTRQRHEHEQAAAEARVKRDLGPELYAQVCALAASLRDHPRRSQALAILRELSS